LWGRAKRASKRPHIGPSEDIHSGRGGGFHGQSPWGGEDCIVPKVFQVSFSMPERIESEKRGGHQGEMKKIRAESGSYRRGGLYRLDCGIPREKGGRKDGLVKCDFEDPTSPFTAGDGRGGRGLKRKGGGCEDGRIAGRGPGTEKRNTRACREIRARGGQTKNCFCGTGGVNSYCRKYGQELKKTPGHEGERTNHSLRRP